MYKLGVRKARRVAECGENLGRVHSEEQGMGGNEARKVSGVGGHAGKGRCRSPSLSSLQTSNRYSHISPRVCQDPSMLYLGKVIPERTCKSFN